MRLAITGLNHRTAPVEVRERMAFDHHVLPDALKALTQRPGLREGVILSTCNRVEIAVAAEDSVNPLPALEEFLAQRKTVDTFWLRPYLYRFEGTEAVRHLFRVAASLDSMVVGEPQILGQLKSAYAVAKAEGCVQGFLDAVLTRAFSVAKRVRTETDIGQSAVSVSYAAVELAREIFGSLAQKRVLLIGAGKMSELAARHLRRSGASHIFVANRTAARAAAMAELFDGQVIEYDQVQARLSEMDIILTSSGAPHYILLRDDMRRVIEARRNRPVFLIDIAVPRNIDPAVNDLDNVFLYDIDDLQRVVEQNLRGRLNEAQQADEIVAEEVERMQTWLRSREAGPMIRSLQEQLEQVRAGEVERLRGKLGALTPQQQQAVEAITKGLVSKIAHGPIAELRRQASGTDGAAVMEAIRRMFRLEENPQ